MDTYSRRQFLQLTGIALVSSQIDFLPKVRPLDGNGAYQGRTLTAAQVYSAKNQGTVVTTLWPDSITPILDAHDRWYRVPSGYVLRETVQPMTPFQPNNHVQKADAPFWAEVAAPVAPIREYCAADAPLITRIGHGGVAQIVDYLPGEPNANGWYKVRNEADDFAGWTQTSYWQLVEIKAVETGDHHLEINVAAQRLTARENGQIILEATCSTNELIQPGSYSLEGRNHSGSPVSLNNAAFQGVPWVIEFGDSYDLAGVYWHNRFGSSTPGPSVQMTPLLARWLFSWLNNDSRIDIL